MALWDSEMAARAAAIRDAEAMGGVVIKLERQVGFATNNITTHSVETYRPRPMSDDDSRRHIRERLRDVDGSDTRDRR
jgi:hypothetical protein